MNQILAVENKEKKKKKKSSQGPIEIKGIVRFFAITIMIFGIVLTGEASYAVYKNIDDRKPANIPTVVVGRVNDKIILRIEHNEVISKITYSWNNGQETVIPVGSTVAQEEITLLGYNSTLNLTVEDMNGKQVSYQKTFVLDGVDITKPTIDINAEDGNSTMIITASDETAIAYLSYQWEGEEAVVIDAETENQTEIEAEVELSPGTKTITVIAEDRNGNVEQLEKEIVTSTSIPQMQILQEGSQFYIQVSDEDGIQDVVINLNGQEFTVGDLNLKEAQLGPLTLREGNNTISIEITNVSGYTQRGATEIQYTP